MIDSRSRFLRRYVLTFSPRKTTGYYLPLVAEEKQDSILAALRKAQSNRTARRTQESGDTISLSAIEHDVAKKTVTLLFHRTSPGAVDPSYLTQVDNEINVRHSSKKANENQAVSAHIVIDVKAIKAGTYKAALEEMPGLSFSVIQQIITDALSAYPYQYLDKKEKAQETYTVFRAKGVKGESLTSALKKKGSLNYLLLTRTNIPDAPDAEGIAEPQTERIRYKIVGDPMTPTWRSRFEAFRKTVKDKAWDDVLIEMSLEDDRHRTVKLDRESEASEILFVRSEQVFFDDEIKSCSKTVIPEIVSAARTILDKPF